MRYHQYSCFSTAIFSSSKTVTCQAEPRRDEMLSARLISVQRLKQAYATCLQSCLQISIRESILIKISFKNFGEKKLLYLRGSKQVQITGYEPPRFQGGWRILKWYIFQGLSCYEILGENYPLGGPCISQGGPGTFWPINYNINN